jgi:predicted phosphodiesterase
MIIIGDHHGAHKTLKNAIKNKHIENETFIHVGDFGTGFTKLSNEMGQIDLWNTFLIERNCMMYVVRGNHDDPTYFDKVDYNFDASNIKFLPDYTVFEVDGKKILGVGGAISIDRVPRIATNQQTSRFGGSKRCWWKGEIFNYDEEKIKKIEGVDIVITHSCPNFVAPVVVKNNWPYIVKQFLPNDPTLESMLVKERKEIGDMCNLLRKKNDIRYWFYGHFHQSEVTHNGPTLFRMLGINELYEHRTT